MVAATRPAPLGPTAPASCDAASAHRLDVYLRPGDTFVGDARHRLRTLLGSCVSITLWHPVLRIGAMSHFLLAERRRPAGRRAQDDDGRYGPEALDLMLAELQRRGVAPQACQAKLFGGGDMFPGRPRQQALHVGRRNGELARALLAEHGIPVLSESLFGVGHRHIVFDIATGDVWSRQMRIADAPAFSSRPPRGLRP